MSKGSTQRPFDRERFDREWDRIFGSQRKAKDWPEVLQSEEDSETMLLRERCAQSKPPRDPA